MNILHGIQQGSPEWLAIRADYDTASEASAALGVSKYQSRTALLKQKRTGMLEEISTGTQALFDRGHAAEAAARPMAEEIIGADLYPVTATLEVDGLKLLASLDGATMDEEAIFEHKLWSESLANAVRAGALDAHYTVQMDQQLLVTGAKRCLFMTSDGTPEKMAYCWYESSQDKIDALIAGWKQFNADLDSYQAPEVIAEVTGRTPETLPALRIEVTGMVTASNLEAFKEHSLAVFGAIKRDLQTDQDFADAEKTVKWCGDVEERLTAAKQHALSQTTTIDELFRTIDDISAEARRVRLDLDKLVKARKESLREEIRQATVDALRAHHADINAGLSMGVTLGMPAAFGAEVANAMKGKKTLSSLRDAADTTLAGAKIEANATAERVRKNIAILESHKAHAFLLADGAQLATSKEPETLELIVKSRIAEHQAAEAKRLEAERARIAEEERIKAEAAAKAELERQQQEVARQQAVLEAAQRQREADAAAAKAEEEAEHRRMVEIERAEEADLALAAHAASIVQDVVPRAAEALAEEPARPVLNPAAAWPAPVVPPSLRLGQITERLGFAVTASLLSELGFEPSGKERAAVLYHEHQFDGICAALIQRIANARAAHRIAEAA